MPAKKLENLKYDDYVAKIKQQYNIKYRNELDQSELRYYESVKAKIAKDPSYDPQRINQNVNDRLSATIVLMNDVRKKITNIKNEQSDALDTEEYRQSKIEVEQLKKDREDANRTMDSSGAYLFRFVKDEIEKNPEYGLNPNKVIKDLVQIYKEHAENPDEDLMWLPTSKALGTEKGNVVYARLLSSNFADIEQYANDIDEYEKQVEICEQNQDKINFVENTENQIEEVKKKTYKDFLDVKITSDGLKFAKNAEDNTMSIKDALDFYQNETANLKELDDEVNANVHYDFVKNNAINAITKNQTDFFDDLASAMKEESNLKPYQKFFASFLPGSIYKPSAIMNKVKALNAVLQESEFPQETIDEQLSAAQERANQQILDDLIANENGGNGELIDNDTVKEVRTKLPAEETKNLGNATAIENKNAKKTAKYEEDDLSINNDLEMDGQPEFDQF